MAQGYNTLGLGAPIHLQQGCLPRPLLKDMNQLCLYQNSCIDLTNPHSFDFNLRRRDFHSPKSSRFLEFDKLSSMDSSSRSPLIKNFQGDELAMLLFGFQVAKQCNRQESILNLLASGSIGKDSSLEDVLFDLSSQQPSMCWPLQSSLSQSSGWHFTDAESEWMSLAYPKKEMYWNQHSAETCNCMDSLLLPQNMYDCSEIKGHYIGALLSAIPELHFPKTSINKPSSLSMLVPYFERRRLARPKTDTSVIQPAKPKKNKRKEKANGARISEDSQEYYNTYHHACENILSLIVDQKQPDKNEIISLNKSGNQVLTDFSSHMGAIGTAIVISVLYGVTLRGAPVCYSHLWSTGFGLGLLWFSWAIAKLRFTLSSICESFGNTTGRDQQKTMMERLNRNLKDIRFRAIALVVILFLAIGCF